MTRAPKLGRPRFSQRLEPVSGKAVPVYKGETLRIKQLEGGQCVDFNCFNLRDHKEYMSVGHMRREGFRAEKGRLIWSNPPRYRPMMKIVHMPSSCATDLLAARCSAVPFEAHYGFEDHPNCQDTLAEAAGEYGLTPDDVHDSFNLWMNTEWDHIGSYTVWNTGKTGDYVDFLALMDVLAVPVTCGSGNLWITSNFSYKPIQIEVLEATRESKAYAEREWRQHASLKTQRTPKDYKNAKILTDPTPRRDPEYVPDYVNFPIEWKEIAVPFSSSELQEVWDYRGTFGDTEDEVVRTLFFHWYLENRKKHGLRWYTPRQSHA